MLSQPNLVTRNVRDAGTDIFCSCGSVVTTLKPGEGVYPKGVLMRTLGTTTTRKASCPDCGASHTIPVTTQ